MLILTLPFVWAIWYPMCYIFALDITLKGKLLVAPILFGHWRKCSALDERLTICPDLKVELEHKPILLSSQNHKNSNFRFVL